ncbi:MULTISPECIES: formylglycine-generating enzyme family protein [unclassified Glycomyces]|uniref:formylglycine-generating enzyme family protein n=1 Tax=Glycomyces sp. NRRL B-16210 TaxID=1463821 RepID=UPI0004C24F7B
MKAIDAGTVTLTDRRTERSWTVALAPFLLADRPVTRNAYAEVTGARFAGDGALPAADVSWLDAVRWCNALSEREGLRPAYRVAPDETDSEAVDWDRTADGYRLPTEAEWEYACRAGTTGPRYGDLDAIAWHRGNSDERPHPVGRKQPNAWGLHDMLGNAWEWCWDVYDAEVYRDYRVIRGGGWFDEHWSCRAGVRRRTMPILRIEDLGFRLARTVRPEPA